jgi:hypothetical protein
LRDSPRWQRLGLRRGASREVARLTFDFDHQHAATDILVLARKRRAFGSLDTLIARQGGQHVLYGNALTLAAAAQTWAASTDTLVREIARAAVR